MIVHCVELVLLTLTGRRPVLGQLSELRNRGPLQIVQCQSFETHHHGNVSVLYSNSMDAFGLDAV
jgi:hypothetical protein